MSGTRLKSKPYRNRKYLDWVKSLDCCVCGRPADDPHHLIGLGGMGGMGTKAPDTMVMPLCREHHNQMHKSSRMQKDQWEYIARTLDKATSEGILP